MTHSDAIARVRGVFNKLEPGDSEFVNFPNYIDANKLVEETVIPGGELYKLANRNQVEVHKLD